MNYLDIIILAPLVWGVYRGFSKGLVIEVASLLALIAGIWCAVHFNAMAASILINDLNLNITDRYLAPVAFAVTFLAVALLIVLVSRIVDKILSAVALGGINKLFGAIFGGLKAFLIVAVVLFFVNQIDTKYGFLSSEKKSSSILYERMVELVEDWLPKIDINKIKKDLPKVDAKVEHLKKV